MQTAIITGATSGIGRASALLLLEKGWKVAGLGRDKDALASLEKRGEGNFVPFRCDLAQAQTRAAVFAQIARAVPAVDLLVNCAGVCTYERPTHQGVEAWSALLQVNVVAVLDLVQCLLGNLQEAAAPMVINVSSVTARHLPAAGFGPYAISKTALDGLTEALRLELAPRGVRVASIAPGLVDTPIYAKVAGFETLRERLEKSVPKWLAPEDVAACIEWMAGRPAHVNVSDLTLLPSSQAR